MSPVVTGPARTGRRPSRTTLVYAAAGAVAVAVVIRLLSGLHPPALRDRVTIENPTAWHTEVHVSRPDGGRVHLGTVARDASGTFRDVIDQGDGWLFRFSYAGEAPVELYLGRPELERARWTVNVPEDFRERMLARGIPPSA